MIREAASREAKDVLTKDRQSVEAKAAAIKQQQQEMRKAAEQLAVERSDLENSKQKLRRGQQQLALERREFERQMASRDAVAEMNAENVQRLERQLTEMRQAMVIRDVSTRAHAAAVSTNAGEREHLDGKSQIFDHLLTQQHEQEDERRATVTWPRAGAIPSHTATGAATTLDVLVEAVGTLSPPRNGGEISGSSSRNNDDDDSVRQDSDDEAALLAEVLNTPEREERRHDRRWRSIPGVRGAEPSGKNLPGHFSSKERATQMHVSAAVAQEQVVVPRRMVASVSADPETGPTEDEVTTFLPLSPPSSVYGSRARTFQAAERLSKRQTTSAPSSARSSIESTAGNEWQRRSADDVVRIHTYTHTY